MTCWLQQMFIKSVKMIEVCYNKAMSKSRFIFVALMCAFETYFFNDCLFEGDYFFAFFWGLFLFLDLQRVYKVDRFIHRLITATKKKD